MDKKAIVEAIRFQSPLPLWGAASTMTPLSPTYYEFQSLLPLWGGVTKALKGNLKGHFNPRPTVGGNHGTALPICR